MDENNQNNTNNPKEQKEPKKANSAAKNQKPGFGELVADHKAEFKKIVWPNKSDVIKKTGTVIVTSIFIGAVVFCMDTVFSQLQALLINVLN